MSVTIRKQSNGKYQAVIEYRTILTSATFPNKGAAERWGKDVERSIDDGRFPDYAIMARAGTRTLKRWFPEGDPNAEVEVIVDDTKPNVGWTLARCLDQYAREVTKHKKGEMDEIALIKKLKRFEISDKAIGEITSEDINAYITMRENSPVIRGGKVMENQTIKANTIRNEVFLLSGVYAHATTVGAYKLRTGTRLDGWGLSLVNPVTNACVPDAGEGRKRRLNDRAKEEQRLIYAIREGSNALEMEAIFMLAVWTGMRRSEILDLRADEYTETRDGARVLARPDSKNGKARNVVLFSQTWDVLDRLTATKFGDAKLFDLKDDQVDHLYGEAKKRAGIGQTEKDRLTFHDLRHEALSRMGDLGLTEAQLASQSGHSDTRMLKRYVHASATAIHAVLNKVNGA